ncbi:diguanylate cyclase domain-containing protein [Synechococcus sp. CS-1328]|uniref:diguanylate cyclase domain-containing protein n=1 Tax=Synechococcus sp. CS-1328 TaxID=2847976 RepID=UPI00223C2D69|nr:diguanylate cyclase [Synechococcus sp. CS-1328]MCT0224767.1 diguanylate cyclase [Synechococcus sp. CS-1328]
MEPNQASVAQAPSGQGRPIAILAVAMVGVFLLDLVLPRNIPLLPYYFLVVVLSAGVATPRQMAPLIVQAYGLAIAAGIYWGFFPSIDYFTRLLALSGVTAVALRLSAQRGRETAHRRRSEQILRLTLDNAAAGVGLADASGRLFRVNPALCRTLGRDAATLQTLSWPEITHPDEISKEQPLVEEMLANRRDSYRIKKRYLRGDGSTVWLDVSVACVRKADGQIDFFIGQGIDISNEVNSLQALVRSEELLRNTLEQTSVGLALCKQETGQIFQSNQTLRAAVPLAPAVLEATPLPQLLRAVEQPTAAGLDHAHDCEAIDTAAVEALLRGESDHYRVRLRLQRPGGPPGWADVRLTNLRDASGTVMHVLMELDDISELVAQTEYLQAAAAAGVVGIWDWDVPRNILHWDPVMYRLYGRNPSQFAGAYEAWADALHPQDKATTEAAIQSALRGESVYAPRFRVVWPDGSVHHLQAASHTSFDRQGRPLRMLGVNYDVTELVQTQEQLQAEQQRLSTTLDSLLEPHLILGPVHDEAGSIVDLIILRANPAAAAYNHMTMEEFVGARILELWREHVSNGLFDRYLEVLSSGEPLILDNFPFQHAQQGGLRYLDIRAVKVGEELSITWWDMSERIMAERELERRAATDSLTSLLNREEMFGRLQRLMAANQRQSDQLALLFCDIDHFKAVNDTYGHNAGDAVLQAMAARVRSCLRSSDLAARIGGDELLVALPGLTGLPDAMAIAEKLRHLAHKPVSTADWETQISMSIGVALAQPGESHDDLIARADAAMYAAKQQGRDQVVAIAGERPLAER